MNLEIKTNYCAMKDMLLLSNVYRGYLFKESKMAVCDIPFFCKKCPKHMECGVLFFTDGQTLQYILNTTGCNLDCYFCDARKMGGQPYSFSGLLNGIECISSQLKKVGVNPKQIELKFTGGEPTLQWDSVTRFIILMKKFFNTRGIDTLKIRVQTNGILLKRINWDFLNKIQKTKIVIEISFKGVNPYQFSALTRKDAFLFIAQCESFSFIWGKQNRNLKVDASLGINHNWRKNKWLRYKNGRKMDFNKYSDFFKKEVLDKLKVANQRLNNEAYEWEPLYL